MFAVHIEGGKHNGSGVQIDITGEAGDLQLVNEHAFGGVDQHYEVYGANGDNQRLARLPIPASYDWLPPTSGIQTGALELADHEVYARDIANGTQTVPTFEDASWMQTLLNHAADLSRTGQRIEIGA